MEKRTEKFKCGQCDKGTVRRILKENRKGCEITMKKCDNCKYQYGIKGLGDLEFISLEVDGIPKKES